MVGYLWGLMLVAAYIAHAMLTTRWARLRSGDDVRVREPQVAKSETASAPSS